MKKMIAIIAISLAWGFTGCEKDIPRDPNADAQGHTPATPVTAAANEQVLEDLRFSDEQDFADSRWGLIASDSELRVKNAKGKTIWNPRAYGFIQAKLNNMVHRGLT